MVKIIIFVAIAALACVNAQNGFRLPFAPRNPAADPFGIFRQLNIPFPKPGPNVNYHSIYAGSDGTKTVISKNDNGQQSEYVFNH